VRLQAAAMFEQDMPPVQVAHQLRVSTKSAYQWRRCWRARGTAGLASRGAGGAVCRLSPGQLARPRAELDKGPAVHGWAEDQRWTLERVTTLIGRLFHVRYTLRGTSYLRTGSGSPRRSRRTARPNATRPRSPAWREVTWVKLRG
jgi:transposase